MNSRLLWGIWFIWALALIIYCLEEEMLRLFLNILLKTAPTLISTLVILFFIRNLLAYKGLNMFKRKEILNENPQPSSLIPEENISVTSFVEKKENNSAGLIKEKEVTLIPSLCHIKGEIEASGDICISGSVKGTITAQKTVHVLPEGSVDGDIYAERVVVDGKVTGTCASETVEINANGLIDGTIESDDLSINKKGHFYGISRSRNANPTPENNLKEKSHYLDVTMVEVNSVKNSTLLQHSAINKQADDYS